MTSFHRADEAKPLGDNPSGVAKVQGAKDEVERGSASAHIQLTTTADENDQPDEAVDDVPDEPPTPPAPPDGPAPRANESPSVELERRRAATSCDARPTTGDTDALEVPGCNRDNRKRPTKLQTTSVRISKRSERKRREDSPMAGRVEQNDPGGKADASGMPEDDEDDWNMPTKL